MEVQVDPAVTHDELEETIRRVSEDPLMKKRVQTELCVAERMEEGAKRFLQFAKQERLKDYGEDHVSAALYFMRKALKLRDDLAMAHIYRRDRISKQFGDLMLEAVSYKIGGVDKRGAVVILFELGKLNTGKLRQAWERGVKIGADGREVDDENMATLWYLRIMEYVRVVVMPKHKDMPSFNRIISIIDAKGAGASLFSNHVRKWLLSQQNVGNLMFGNMLIKVYITSVPRMVKPVWGLIKPLLDPCIAAKVSLSSGDEHKEVLLVDIDRDQLLESLGGSQRRNELIGDFYPDLLQQAGIDTSTAPMMLPVESDEPPSPYGTRAQVPQILGETAADNSVVEPSVTQQEMDDLWERIQSTPEKADRVLNELAVAEQKDDALRRFLMFAKIERPRDFRGDSVGGALHYIDAALDLRAKMAMDRIFDQGRISRRSAELISHAVSFGIGGADKYGATIVLFEAGKLKPNDFSKAWDNGVFIDTSGKEIDECNQCNLWYLRLMEYARMRAMPDQYASHAPHYNRVVSIIDAKGMGLRSFTPQVRKWLLAQQSVGNIVFANMLKKVYVVNVPTLVRTLWNMIKLLLDKTIASKVELLTEKETKEALATAFDKDQLPKSLGGSCDRKDLVMDFGRDLLTTGADSRRNSGLNFMKRGMFDRRGSHSERRGSVTTLAHVAGFRVCTAKAYTEEQRQFFELLAGHSKGLTRDSARIVVTRGLLEGWHLFDPVTDQPWDVDNIQDRNTDEVLAKNSFVEAVKSEEISTSNLASGMLLLSVALLMVLVALAYLLLRQSSGELPASSPVPSSSRSWMR
mmetsp:Transcript_35749/g.75879  ORF Transcript_35749/g.75879 Transcript_35749/m.75879 type:complete len:805 (+) Transcript_35749:62-2476(+)